MGCSSTITPTITVVRHPQDLWGELSVHFGVSFDVCIVYHQSGPVDLITLRSTDHSTHAVYHIA